MCLGIPAKVVEFVEGTERQLAEVDVEGVKRRVNVGLVEEDGLEPGDWILLHVGFAISTIDEEEARRTYEFLSSLEEQYEEELEDFSSSEIGPGS